MGGIRKITNSDLGGKIIDIHTHCGIGIQSYIRGDYPYCQSVESLNYRQKANGVDFTVTFPLSTDNFFDLKTLVYEGRAVPAEEPFSPAPYVLENKMLFKEIYRYNTEDAGRFLPFIMADPGRKAEEQVKAFEEIEDEYHIYGIKIAPVQCQSKITALLEEGRPIIEYAKDRKLPLLFHVTVHPQEEYSQVSDSFKVAERYPELRYLFAHCVGFNKDYLELADKTENVWVDTSALKIQVQATNENQGFMAGAADRFDWNYSDHRKVMLSLVENFPDTIIWGSDSPAYTYITRRLQGENNYVEFRLKGRYEDEKAALDYLPADLRRKASCENAIAFLFGKK